MPLTLDMPLTLVCPGAPRRAAALAVTLMLALSGCGALVGPGGPAASDSSAPASDAGGSGSGADSGAESTGEADASPSPSDGSSESRGPLTLPDSDGADDGEDPRSEPLDDLPKRASDLAGGPVPEGATVATDFLEGADGTRYAVVSSPSGNITCYIASSSNALCTITDTSVRTGVPEGETVAIAVTGESVPAPQPVPDGLPDGRGATVDYGHQVHYAGVVCASEKTSMTCWDVTSGHGASLSKRDVTGF